MRAAETQYHFEFFSHYIDRIPDLLNDAIEFYPCNILFVHKAGEQIKKNKATPDQRKQEIAEALPQNCIHVPVLPVKMMETWLLTDKQAILKAAGNPNSKRTIDLPPPGKLETCSTPKDILYKLLRNASGQKRENA